LHEFQSKKWGSGGRAPSVEKSGVRRPPHPRPTTPVFCVLDFSFGMFRKPENFRVAATFQMSQQKHNDEPHVSPRVRNSRVLSEFWSCWKTMTDNERLSSILDLHGLVGRPKVVHGLD